MTEHDLIAHYQKRLLEILDSETTAESIQQKLIEEFQDTSLEEYVREFSPAMIYVAAQLVRKWGVRYSHLASQRPDMPLETVAPE